STSMAGPDQAKCSEGTSTSFNLSGTASNGTPAWSVVSQDPTITNISFGNQNSAVTTVTLTGTGTATLRLTITNPDSCGNATDEIVLTVYLLPVCSITGDDTLCSGETTEFCGPLGLSFCSWSGPNDFMSADRCTGQISTAGVYPLTITDSNGC